MRNSEVGSHRDFWCKTNTGCEEQSFLAIMTISVQRPSLQGRVLGIIQEYPFLFLLKIYAVSVYQNWNLTCTHILWFHTEMKKLSHPLYLELWKTFFFFIQRQVLIKQSIFHNILYIQVHNRQLLYWYIYVGLVIFFPSKYST